MASKACPCQPPIDILPDEILSEILFGATDAHAGYLERYRFPAVLSRVSRRWRAVAYRTPRIWSMVFICDRATLAHTQDRVLKAGGIPLEIRIHDPKADLAPGDVLKSLLSRCDRWVSLWMNVSSVGDYATHLPDKLPLLQNLFLEDNGGEFVMNTSLPRLRYMKLNTCCLCWGPSFTFESLTDFQALYGDHALRFPITRLLDFLRSAPNLESLELNDSWVFDHPTTNESVLALISGAVDLSRLETMRLEGLLSWEIVMLLSCVRTPNLRRLVLSIDPLHVEENSPPLLRLTSFDLNIPSLQELTLGSGMTKDQAEQVLFQMKHIHTLSVIGTGSNAHHALISLLTKPSFMDVSERLSKIYIRDTPMAKLHGLLCNASLKRQSKSLLHRAIWKIRPTKTSDEGAESIDAVNQERVLLGQLHVMMPHLEITEEIQWWDCTLED